MQFHSFEFSYAVISFWDDFMEFNMQSKRSLWTIYGSRMTAPVSHAQNHLSRNEMNGDDKI